MVAFVHLELAWAAGALLSPMLKTRPAPDITVKSFFMSFTNSSSVNSQLRIFILYKERHNEVTMFQEKNFAWFKKNNFADLVRSYSEFQRAQMDAACVGVGQ